MKLARCVIGPALLALGLLSAGTAAATCTPQVSVVEMGADQPGGGILGQYVMTTGDLCGLQIVALAVDNNRSLAAFANLAGWNAVVVTDDSAALFAVAGLAWGLWRRRDPRAG